MMVQPHQAQEHWKVYDNNGKDWYFRFDADNEMSYKYTCILSVPKLEWGRMC